MIDNIELNDAPSMADSMPWPSVKHSPIDKAIYRHGDKLAKREFHARVKGELKNLLKQVNQEIESTLETIRIADELFLSTVSIIAYYRRENVTPPWTKKREHGKPSLPIGLAMPSNKVINPAFKV